MLLDPYDAIQDARSEARYETDPMAEPDPCEVADELARMRLGYAESVADGLIFNG